MRIRFKRLCVTLTHCIRGGLSLRRIIFRRYLGDVGMEAEHQFIPSPSPSLAAQETRLQKPRRLDHVPHETGKQISGASKKPRNYKRVYQNPHGIGRLCEKTVGYFQCNRHRLIPLSHPSNNLYSAPVSLIAAGTA